MRSYVESMKRIILVGLAVALAQASHAQTARVDAEIDALTARVEKLEGTRAVKKLQRAFGYYVDRGLWGEAADLFADDGTIEIGIDGVYVGKARIREYLKRLHGGQEGLIYGQLNEWMHAAAGGVRRGATAAAPRRAGATTACWASTRSTPNGAMASTRIRT